MARCCGCSASTEGKDCDLCEKCGNLAHSDCMTMNEEYACICTKCYEILAVTSNKEFDKGFDFAIEVVNKVLENLEENSTLQDFKESLEYELELIVTDD